ncbi:MAG: hypothetical protein WB822_07690 [Rhodoplanes sp.]
MSSQLAALDPSGEVPWYKILNRRRWNTLLAAYARLEEADSAGLRL